MTKKLIILAISLGAVMNRERPATDLARWEQQARNVTITRDDWGIAHVHGKTDADAVFGMIYAQAEDDFNRVERNFITSQGRSAEADGDSLVYQDLRMKLFIDPDTMKTLYTKAPEWLRKLMDAWADALNFYLAKHPAVKPLVITRFEPWMALTFSEGSIGGDIESINVRQLGAIYGGPPAPAGRRGSGDGARDIREPTGSNGIAIGPAVTASKHAMLLINPHTSFFFRSELQMTSDEGLNAYGAATWGQFFVYQGFNEHAGWMHTSSGVDNIDEYAETVTKKGDGYVYKYGTEERPVTVSRITIPFKTASGMQKKEITVYRTHHGPIVRKTADGKWIAVRLMNDPLKALTQSFSRTKSTNLKTFRETMELHTNSSNNTLFADAEGNIAYFHANYIPKRDLSFDWSRPVDGSNPKTEWNGIHSIDESPNVFNPRNGWVYNSNNWPWSAAGPGNSPKRENFPAYFDEGRTEQPRGYHAIRVLSNKRDFTLDGFRAAAYDTYMPSFAQIIPPLLKAYDALPKTNPLAAKLSEPIAQLRAWDYRWSVTSVPTTLAVVWGDEVSRMKTVSDSLNRTMDARRAAQAATRSTDDFIAQVLTGEQLVNALSTAVDGLTRDFGTWRTPWGDINRFQRLTDDIVHPFTDAGASIPVGFPSARYGSLASFGARHYRGSKKIYGSSGNSFVAVVEFGPKVTARAVTAGGESGDPKSKHFADQAQRYATGDLRPVYFYPSDLKGHIEREYKPGN